MLLRSVPRPLALEPPLLSLVLGQRQRRASIDARAAIEQLVSPAYFRALVTGESFDAGFSERCVRSVLAAA